VRIKPSNQSVIEFQLSHTFCFSEVTNKLTNEGWARGRDPEHDERFLEIEETLMGTD
jgi:hypothetical protein